MVIEGLQSGVKERMGIIKQKIIREEGKLRQY